MFKVCLKIPSKPGSDAFYPNREIILKACSEPLPLCAGLRKVMVRAHRQAWCWQDEWYGLTIEDIRQLELETQLALAKKMAQYSHSEEGAGETNGPSGGQDPEQGSGVSGPSAETEGGRAKLGDSLETRGELTKQWSTSSRSSNRSSKRGGEVPFFITLKLMNVFIFG